MKFKSDIDRIQASLTSLADTFPADFLPTVEHITSLNGDVITVGIGKSGIIANKLSATLCSVGVRSFYVHPVEAVHGDLGRVRNGDFCIIISHSGNSPELRGFLNYCETNSIAVCAITGNPESYLANCAKYILHYPAVEEICPINLAPTVSTTLALIISDLLAVEVMRRTGFSALDFKKHHPGGSLGSSLQPVNAISRPLQELETIDVTGSAEDLLDRLNATKFGLVLVMDQERVKGVITDGDYRRCLLKGEGFRMAAVLTENPISVSSFTTIKEIKSEFKKNNINVIFVTENNNIHSFVHVSQVAMM